MAICLSNILGMILSLYFCYFVTGKWWIIASKSYFPWVCKVSYINPVCALWCFCVLMRVYLKAWVGNEPGVIAQVCSVVLHHALCFWLTEVLIGRGETTSCQHHCGGLWERDTEEKKKLSEMLISVWEQTTAKKDSLNTCELSSTGTVLGVWCSSYRLWRAVWSAGRSWADPAGLNDDTTVWSWGLCSGSSAASPGSQAAHTRCTGWTTCPEPGRQETGGGKIVINYKG